MSLFERNGNYLYSGKVTLEQWKERVLQEYPTSNIQFETWESNELADEDYTSDVFAVMRGAYKTVGIFEQECMMDSTYCSIRLGA